MPELSGLPRVKAELWVQAYVRTVMGAGAAAFVVRRGDADAGAILIKLNRLDGQAMVLVARTGPEGRVWIRATGEDWVADAAAEERLATAFARDPDLWIVEVEDRAGRHFLIEPVA